jgi:hypothetical protein
LIQLEVGVHFDFAGLEEAERNDVFNSSHQVLLYLSVSIIPIIMICSSIVLANLRLGCQCSQRNAVDEKR